jgi:hypothetical protein
MNHSRLRANGHRSQGFKQIRWSLVFVLLTAITGFCPPSQGQSTASSPAAPASCPVQLLDLDLSPVNVKIRNSAASRSWAGVQCRAGGRDGALEMAALGL